MAFTYYVRTDGDDDHTGRGGFEGGQCWATIQKAATTAVAGDTVYIAGDDGTYGTGIWTLSSKITFATSGTYNNMINFIAIYGHVKLDGNRTANNCIYVHSVYFLNFTAEDETTDRWELYGAVASGFETNTNFGGKCEHMDSYNNGARGFYFYWRTIGIFRDLRAWNNFTIGIELNQSSIYGAGLYNCISYLNGSHGIVTGNGFERIVNCISHSNGASGFWSYYAYGVYGHFEHNVSANNDDDGFIFVANYATPRFPAVYNNIFAHNGRYGINFPAANYDEAFDLKNNCFYDNTSGNVNNGSTGENPVTSDPEFTDPDNDDYTLQNTSPCINAGYPQLPLDSNKNIGFFQATTGSSIVIASCPTSFSQVIYEAETAYSQTFSLWNSGTGTLTYTITDDVTWLSVLPASGTSAGETDQISITYDTADLVPGSYSATITITDVGASNNPQTISVNLVVVAQEEAVAGPYDGDYEYMYSWELWFTEGQNGSPPELDDLAYHTTHGFNTGPVIDVDHGLLISVDPDTNTILGEYGITKRWDGVLTQEEYGTTVDYCDMTDSIGIIYKQKATPVQNTKDVIQAFPDWMIKYAEKYALGLAYQANTDAYSEEKSNWWFGRYGHGLKILRKYKGLAMRGRKPRLKTTSKSRFPKRLVRMPDGFPKIPGR